MRVLTTIDELRHQVHVARGRGERIGLVPTRGNLHAGHSALVRLAHAQCQLVICAVVRAASTRPLGGSADLDDVHRADSAGAHLLWRPPPGPLLPAATTRVVPAGREDDSALATATVQTLGIVQPDVTYVGEQQYAHARLLHDVVRDLCLDLEIRISATPRTPDGLPLGGASGLEDPAARQAAASVPAALEAVAIAVAAGERSLFRLQARAEGVLANAGDLLDVDDVAAVHPDTFAPASQFAGPVLFVVRARVAGTALVDARLLEPLHATS